MKLGYQDTGSWTLLSSTPLERRKAAWLYAQFVTAKTVSLKKTLVGLTPFRDSDIRSQAMTDMAPKLGGLVEFYRSPARTAWTPTGANVPDYPKLAQLWWANVANAVSGQVTAQAAMDSLATQQDRVLERLQRHGALGECGPALNEEQDAQYWLDQPGAPKPALGNEKPQGKTVDYETLLASWVRADADANIATGANAD